MTSHEFLYDAMIYLSAALVMVPVAHRLGLGSVLGYLASGVFIGPSVFGLIHSPEQVLHFSEFGVVLFLFLIGLELNPRRLWKMRKPILGMGGLQVGLCVFMLAGVGLLFQFHWNASVIIGMGFAMSSTALALQLLREKKLHQVAVGESSFAVLLFQDLAIIPMLAALPLLTTSEVSSQSIDIGIQKWIPLGKGILALITVIFLGRYLVRPIFRWIVQTQLRELVTGLALALVFSVAYLMDAVGLSMALGTFLAGVLLAESEFRHELEIDIEPFKGLLLGLFFIAVGMSMNLAVFYAQPIRLLSFVAACLLVKIVTLFWVARFFKHTSEESRIFGIALSQGGEFAFVLFGVAGKMGILQSQEQSSLTIVVALSMALTPFVFLFYDKWIHPWFLQESSIVTDPEHQVRAEGNPVILAGYGRIGQVIGRLLHSQGIKMTILERDPSQIEIVKKFGMKTFYGDVSRLDLLRSAGAANAKLLILAIDDMDAIHQTITLVRENFPNLKILVRAESRIDAYHFINLKVPVVRATFAPGLEMAEEALKLLSYPAFEARTVAQKFKRYDVIQLRQSSQHVHDIDKLISITTQSREELARIMETDERKRTEIVGDGWG